MDNDSVKIFVDSWRIYEKVYAHNSMHHADFLTLVKKYLEQKFGKSLIHFLDLGCGDACIIPSLLKELNIESYTGYDLSGTVLEYADKKLAGLGFKYTLAQKDIREAIKEVKGEYEIIYGSFVIHHFPDEEKKEMINAIYNLLAKGGVFVYIDIFRHKGQTRIEYLEDYMKNIYTDWHYLATYEKQAIADHILNYDFPAEEDWFEEALLHSGYTLYSQPVNYSSHQLMILEKNS